jgi:nitrogen-specific signal transduction histidine kinase/CheY-like chemotaxis protein
MDLPDGTVAYQCQAIDITERKTLLDQLVHAQKLSALGRFAGGVAHDFNNVLTAVLGYASLLRSDLEAEGRGLEEVEGIEQAARRAAALSRQLLMFSRQDTTEASVFSMAGLVRDIEKMLRRIIGDTALLTVRSEGGFDMVMADKSRMEQAVVNLVANARDAMPSGGRIFITTGAQHVEGGSSGKTDPPPAGNWAFVEVLDEGTGIAPEILQKVFDPFFTTKSPDKGTGLGLSTVASIVRQAEGHIRLSSIPGKGTTIRLLFPLVDAGKANGKALTEASRFHGSRVRGQARQGNADHPGNGRTVLVVENDNSVLTILEALLDKAGYRVMAAGHPGEALLMAENARSLPELLVADMAMPLMSGLELAARLRESVPKLPAILLRSRDGNPAEDAVAGAMGSLETCIDKPFSEDDLLGAVDSLLYNQQQTPS